MLPLIPILLIAKLSLALPATKGGMSSDELEEYVKNLEKNYPAQYLLDSSASLLVAYHTLLVLLQASYEEIKADIRVEDPQTHVVETFQNKMLIASFTPEHLPWLEGSKNVIKNVGQNSDFADIPTIIRNDYSDNIKPCLEMVSELPDDFNTSKCLSNCLSSAQVQRKDVLWQALKLGLDIVSSADLEQARTWTKEANSLTNTKKWLLQRMGLENDFQDQINSIDDIQAKLVLRQVRAMLFESSKFYKEVISRLNNMHNGANIGNDILQATSKISENLNPNQKESWKNLRRALYGAVSWHMYCQVQYATDQIRYLLKISNE